MPRKTSRPQDPAISRRVFLTRAGGITLSLGAASWWLPRTTFGRDPYQGGVWLAGDHHIHTKYSPDGLYEIATQVEKAAHHGLNWCVITDHGGPHHDKIALSHAYPELLSARQKFPNIRIFQGLEWNIPSAEHGSVILPPTHDEAKRIAEFEALYDEKNISQDGTPANTEADAVAAVKYLETLRPSPLFLANHPARRGRDSPSELRSWDDAAPNVFTGFEGAAGHQAASLVGLPRGGYDKALDEKSWPQYPTDCYRTWGGFDFFVTKIGGLWDSLLGEGRPWYITSNSDSHAHWTDHQLPEKSTYDTLGWVTVKEEKSTKHVHEDFWPGEYNKTWVHARSNQPLAILDALRHGSMFAAHGGLVDRLELTARSEDAAAPMGGTLQLDKAGQDVNVSIKLRAPKDLHHLDLIAGDISGIAKDRNSTTNPTTKLIKQFTMDHARRAGQFLSFDHVFKNVRRSFYIRLRGTNRESPEPTMDTSTMDPWKDLWFYSNPVMIRTERP